MKKQRNKNIDKHKNSWHNLETVSEDGSNNNKTTSFSIEKKRPETNGKSNETKSIIDKMHYKLANSLKILKTTHLRATHHRDMRKTIVFKA